MQAFDITSEENPSFVGGTLHSAFRPQNMRALACVHRRAVHMCHTQAVLKHCCGYSYCYHPCDFFGILTLLTFGLWSCD